MAERRVNDLSYGHFGQAVYEPSRKEWIFTRQPGIRNQLRPIAPPRVSIPPSLRLVEPEKRPQRQALQQQTQLLGRHHPELVPGLTLLPSLLHTSQLITSLTTVHDPTISTLLAFGRAVDIDNQRSGARTIPVAAIAGGEAGEAVKIIHVRDERVRWGGHKGVRLSMPEVGGGEEGWWFGDGAPVRQICFGDSESGNTCASTTLVVAMSKSIDTSLLHLAWLAIRLPASTIILRPLYHRLPTVTGASSKRWDFSRINPNHLFTISMSRTGGVSHSDVAFNPWYNRQCAVIDQNGQWSVWDLEGQKKKRNLSDAKARQSGSVLDNSFGGNANGNTTGEDGWAAVCWAGDVSTLVVCNRRHLAVFDLKSDPPTRLKVPQLDLERTPNWILSMRRSPINNSHLFVVTTSQVFKLEICGNNPDIRPGNWKAGARILLSWRHFRDGDDTSLRLEVLGSHDVEHVLIYSRFNKLVTAFQFSHSSEPSSIPTSVSDPYIFPLPRDSPSPSERDQPGTDLTPDVSISTLHLLPLKYVTRPNIAPTGPGQTYIEQGVVFYKLFILGNDLSLHDCLYTSGVPRGGSQLAGESTEGLIVVEPPDNRVRLQYWAGRSTGIVFGDGFITEDGAEEDSEQEDHVEMTSKAELGGIGNHVPHPNSRITQVEKDLGDASTLNFEPIYNLAFLQSDRRTEPSNNEAETSDHDTDTEETQLDLYLRTLEGRVLAKRDTGFRPIETLLELYAPQSYFEGIDSASIELRQFLYVSKTLQYEGESEKMVPAIKALVPHSFFKFPFQRNANPEQQAYTHLDSLLELYDQLVGVWVASLPSTASGKMRLAKERIARRVAAELYLSSIGVALKGSEQEREIDPSEQAGAEGYSIEIPIRPRGELSGVTAKGKGKEKQRESQSPPQSPTLDASLVHRAGQAGSSASSHSRLSFPTSDSTPSLHSYRSSQSGESGIEDASCTRLRAYTSLTSQPPLPVTMSNILAHWKIDSDPLSYSWNATRAALAGSGDDGDKEVTTGGDEASSQRLRREKRLLKRQRRGTVESAASSQPTGTERPWGSQPVAMLQSSRGQADGDIAPASQIVRGVYGGRLARAAAHKGKKRTAGF
ncbi:MAG: hypothetical protein M1839_008777 [Geoglossum umbratile]|nr:MAG: hypothetical protein M1839_008777 [Geoglossum umbratile]